LRKTLFYKKKGAEIRKFDCKLKGQYDIVVKAYAVEFYINGEVSLKKLRFKKQGIR